MDESTSDLLIVFRSRHRAACREFALVLQAVGIEHEIRWHFTGWTIAVPAHRAEEAAGQLELYRRENRNWPRRPPAVPTYRVGSAGVAGYAIVLLVVAAAQQERLFGRDWFGAGRLEAGSFRDGEWWRAFTALTLHVDGQHLIGNLLFGAAFGLIAGHLLGNGLAWCSIVATGAVGNALDALVHPAQHAAVGASTAVFGTLGLWAAYVWRRRRDLRGRWAVQWAPLVGAAVLFAYAGSGGERTDVIAHLTGFLSGIALGAWYGGFESGIGSGPKTQALLGAAAVAVLAIAWTAALVR